MTRFVIGPGVAPHLARENALVSSEHQLLAPTLMRLDRTRRATFDAGMGSRRCMD